MSSSVSMDRFGAPMTDPGSYPPNAAFMALRSARVSARSRLASLCLDGGGDQSMLDQSAISVFSSSAADSLMSPAWSTVSDRSPMDLFSPAYPNLFAMNETTNSSMEANKVSIVTSLQSPGQFGSNADWTPRHPAPTARSERQRHSESFEFTPILPPSFPGAGLAQAPIGRPRSASFGGHSALAPKPLLRLRLEGSFVMGGQRVDISEGFLARPMRMAPAAAATNADAVLRRQNHSMVPRRRNLSGLSRGSRHNSSSDNESSGSSGSRAENCSYCRSVSAPSAGHNKHNCPLLFQLPPCRICGASGKDNHTETHCPNEEKVYLEFIPFDRRRCDY